MIAFLASVIIGAGFVHVWFELMRTRYGNYPRTGIMVRYTGYGVLSALPFAVGITALANWMGLP